MGPTDEGQLQKGVWFLQGAANAYDAKRCHCRSRHLGRLRGLPCTRSLWIIVAGGHFCMEWRTKNQMGKLLDGPDMAKGCQYYLEHRSEADEADDARRWDKRLEAAHARWDAMANK